MQNWTRKANQRRYQENKNPRTKIDKTRTRKTTRKIPELHQSKNRDLKNNK